MSYPTAFNTPDYFLFSSREGFDYKKYVEDASHADKIISGIETSTRKRIASDEALANLAVEAQVLSTTQMTEAFGGKIEDFKHAFQDGISGLSQELSINLTSIDANLVSGFEQVEYSIDELKATVAEVGYRQVTAIHNMAGLMDARFNSVIWELSGVNNHLSDLVKIASNPSQTWAKEQYEIAKSAFERGLYEEALDYIDRAINGYGEKVGQSLEHRFFLLKGILLLGGANEESLEHIDLDVAFDSFKKAIRYSKGVSIDDYSKSLYFAGYTLLCLKKFDTSEDYLRKSIQANPRDSLSHYHYSLILGILGQLEGAKTHLTQAFILDPKLGLRFCTEDGYLDSPTAMAMHKLCVEEAFSIYTEFSKEWLQKRIAVHSKLNQASMDHDIDIPMIENELPVSLIEIKQFAENNGFNYDYVRKVKASIQEAKDAATVNLEKTKHSLEKYKNCWSPSKKLGEIKKIEAQLMTVIHRNIYVRDISYVEISDNIFVAGPFVGFGIGFLLGGAAVFDQGGIPIVVTGIVSGIVLGIIGFLIGFVLSLTLGMFLDSLKSKSLTREEKKKQELSKKQEIINLNKILVELEQDLKKSTKINNLAFEEEKDELMRSHEASLLKLRNIQAVEDTFFDFSEDPMHPKGQYLEYIDTPLV